MTDTAAPAPAARQFSLGDRYTTESGEILATGVQALARLPMDQMRADRRAGLETAAFISGYQGSPLGGYDRELQSQRALLDELRIVHRPALNEELGATAVTGSQVAQTFASHRYDGVLGIWYGKSPGVDRAGDAIRHGNFAGTARHGGVLALTGDDPACKSSTLPSRSEVTLAALGLVVLYPGTVQDVLDLGLHGVALSRASGLWTAVKIVTSVADGSGTALVDPDRIRPIVPTLEIDGRPWTPTLTSNIMTPSLEAELLGPRTEMALRYIVENDLNRIIVDAPRPWLGIVAGGHACEQVMEALATLGLDETGSGRGRRARPQARRAVTVRRAVRPPARRRHVDRPRRRGQVAQRRDAGARRAVRRRGPAPGAGQAGRRGPAAGPAHRRAHRPRAWSSRCAAC